MHITIDDLTGPEVHQLLQQHLQGMAQHSPPDSMHALDLSGLRQPAITFWTAWDGDDLLGCGAMKNLGDGHAEIKSMRTAARFLRQGVARALLAHIVDEARRRGCHRLSLETGTAAAFQPAHALYASVGFVACPPFADYAEDPHSLFMSKAL